MSSTLSSKPVTEATLDELAQALSRGELSAYVLAEAHLSRIGLMEPRFNAVITINPQALEIARQRDRAAAHAGRCGALDGIPVMVKDNVDTGDGMPTTGGSLALANRCATTDSTVVARLRESGAVLLGKTNLSEWANFRSTRSSSGWSSVGGQTGNAYDPTRTPGGSSSGSAVAVSLGYCSVAIGTETDGSIVGPASMNGIVGIKPTVGLVSRAGIVPIAHSQDTAGPMARSVRDAAIVLDVIAAADPLDAMTIEADTRIERYSAGLASASLRGKRLGVARAYSGFHDRVDQVFDRALEALRDGGAVLVDPVDLPSAENIRPLEQIVMETEFKADLQSYLATRAGDVGIRNLADLVSFNEQHRDQVMPHFGQERQLAALVRGGLDDPDYMAARQKSFQLAGPDGIDAALSKHRLDAIIAPTHTVPWLIDWLCGDNRRGGCSTPAAVAGYPHVTVPMGFVEGLPVGLSFMAGAYADREVIRLAYAFEQHTRHRRAPNYPPDANN